VNLILFLAAWMQSANPTDTTTVVVVVGAAGSREYGQQFHQWAERWQAAAAEGGAAVHGVGEDADANRDDREHLRELLQSQTGQSTAPLWVVLIGHGTFDGQHAKFNLRGPDVTAAELDSWLQPVERPQVIINCSSSSAPFINRLSASKRVVVTATKSGFELNYARFGEYLCAAIVDSEADLDKDGQTSLLEAFLSASARVSEFYAQEARLRTETALMDDNGDGRGTPAAWFRGIHTTRQPRDAATEPDGPRAHQIHLVPHSREQEMPPSLREQRDELELQIVRLRESRDGTESEDEYYAALEPLLVKVARIYDQLERQEASSD
jgi:hypothetical protein